MFGVKMCLGVIFDAESESGVRIENGLTVTEIRQSEVLPAKFSRTALLTDLGVVLVPDSESVVRIQKYCTVMEIVPLLTQNLYFFYTLRDQHRDSYTYIHTNIHIDKYNYIHSRTYIYIHTYTRIHIHTYTCHILWEQCMTHEHIINQ